MESLRQRLSTPRDIASLAVLRILFGGLMFAATVRFVASGWVERCFGRPTFFFPYFGLEWIEPLPYEGMLAVHVAMAVAALLVCIGLFYRVAAPAFFVLFTYVELTDVTNYLNHYYLVSLLALLFAFLPANGAFSLDARRDPSLARATIPAWVVYLLRLQVGVVYFYAGVAKIQPDWLLAGQPLGIWLAARTETPVVGQLFALPETALVMSWAGMLNDVLAPFLLLHRRTRPYAFAMILVFHFFTHVLFTIGVFPFLMPIAATIFFAPDWPRVLRARTSFVSDAPASRPHAMSRWALFAVAAYAAIQVLLPMRPLLYEGSVIWHEQGMRFGWRVMLREKNGSVTYRVRARGWGHERYVSPSEYLTSYQEREMSGQPDMILSLAHHIAEDFRARGEHDIEVRADALVSLNGRPAAHLIDPQVDLARIDDGYAAARFIAEPPRTEPLSALSRRALAAR